MTISGQQEATGIVAELREIEQRYEALFGLQQDALCAFDTEGRLVGGNAALELITGYPLRELLGRSYLSLIAEAERGRAWRHFLRAVRGEAQSFEVDGVSRDGREFCLAMTLVPTLSAGVVDGVHGIGRDTTRVRELERALYDLEERYSILAENVHDMISLHDTSGAFLYISPSVSTLLGHHPVELIGRSVYDIIEPADVAAMRASHEAIMRHEATAPATFRARRSDGTVRWFESTARLVLHEESGSPWRIAAVTRDITDRLAIEQQLIQSQKMEAVGRLAGAIAHDFNNVLTVIGGHAEMLTQQLDDPAVRSGAEYIREAARRAAALAKQLLLFGQEGTATVALVDPNTVLLQLQPLLVRVLGPDVKLVLDLDPDIHTVACEGSALEQIAMDLAVNAKDAMPAGGSLVLRTETVTLPAGGHVNLVAGDYIVLSAADTGVGMTPETASHVFEPFFTTKADRGGTGLGLSTVYSMVRRAGGTVVVESAPGDGTTFRIYLPAQTGEADTEATGSAEAEPLQGTETILVVEDDPGVRALVTAALQRYGYNVMSAVDGRQGLSVFRMYGHLIDLVLTDISMPELTGPDMVAAVRADGAAPPVVYMSGFTADALPAADAGPSSFLPKPFTPLQLATAVRDALRAAAS